MKTYDPLSTGWVGIPSTDATTISNDKGYMLMVRGDRTVTTGSGTATPTILETAGKIYSPGTDAPYTSSVGAGRFQSAGNPYASAIDFNLVIKTGDVDNNYYVWDPRLTQMSVNSAWGLGAYQTFTWNGSGYDVTPGGGSYTTGNYYLQSGQAFLYHSAGAGGTLTFTENCKVDGDDLVTRPGTPFEMQQIVTNLYAIQSGNPVLSRWQFLRAMYEQCLDRRRGRTERGFIGQFSHLVQVGDIVFLPLGSPVPFCIRPKPDGTYMLLGDCYVHGIMNGEAFDLAGVTEVDVLLS